MANAHLPIRNTDAPAWAGCCAEAGIATGENVHQHAPSGHTTWGLAEYDRPLTDEEIEEYELEFIAITVINDGKDEP